MTFQSRLWTSLFLVLAFGPQIIWGLPFLAEGWYLPHFPGWQLTMNYHSVRSVTFIQFLAVVALWIRLSRAQHISSGFKIVFAVFLIVFAFLLAFVFTFAEMFDGFML